MPAARVSPADSAGRCRSLSSERHSSSSECPSLQEANDEDEKDIPYPNLSAYQKVVRRLQTDEKWHRDILIGRRIGFYRLKEELGTGNFSQVRAATHALTKERVAVKILDKSKLDNKTQTMLAREIASMESLHHPHVIRLFEVLETLSRIYLVMEYAGGGELFHKISQNGRFTEKAAKPIFAQITAAVDHMHQHNIVHRDIKAENVFYSGPDTVKVGDFGFSTSISHPTDPLRTFCGSPPYAAPELFRDDSYRGPSVDVWALGVLLHFMLTATMPFRAQTVAGLKRQILEGEFTLPDFISTDCHYLIRGILRQVPQSRTTLEQIKNSNWLRGQVLPHALPKDEMTKDTTSPSISPSRTSLSSAELCVRKKLGDFGINETMVEDAKVKGSRSSIMGTYRIVMQRTLSEMMPAEKERLIFETPQFLKSKDSPKKSKCKKNKSKMCVML